MLRAAGGKPGRYMQCFMYVRSCPEDNHYAHPLDLVVVLDMNTKQVSPCCLTWLAASAGYAASAGCDTGVRQARQICVQQACTCPLQVRPVPHWPHPRHESFMRFSAAQLMAQLVLSPTPSQCGSLAIAFALCRCLSSFTTMGRPQRCPR